VVAKLMLSAPDILASSAPELLDAVMTSIHADADRYFREEPVGEYHSIPSTGELGAELFAKFSIR
jgi:hypothetical protein